METPYIVVLTIVIVIIMLVIATCFHLGKITRHKKRKIVYDQVFEKMIQMQGKKCVAIEFTRRCGIYYQTFFFYQFLSKGINIMSLILTVLSMVATSEPRISMVSSMLALVCVAVMIYLNPGKRAEQYLYAWRLCDIKIYEIICCLDGQKEELYKKIDEIPGVIERAEGMLTSDAE